MKKILAGLFGILVVMSGANAVDPIKAATTNTVRKSVYNINYGVSGTTDGRGYRQGVVPQTNELNTARGASDIATSGVTVGNLASVTASNGTVTAGGTGGTLANGAAPTQTIKANTANIAVLDRDKLVVPGSGGSCVNGAPCGYVSTGGHTNNPVGTTGFASGTNDRVWLKIQGDCAVDGSGNETGCTYGAARSN